MTSKITTGATFVAGDPAETNQASRDWDAFSLAVFGPAALVAWKRAAYCLVRADKGKGSVPEGTVLKGAGTGWATVCHHGTVRPTTTGNAAERGGKDRASWCKACASGADATVPIVGAAKAPAAPRKAPAKARTAKGAAKAPATPEEAPAAV